MNPLERYLARIWRACLSSGSLLTLDELAEVLPGKRDDAETWARTHLQAVGDVAGVAVYRWGDVLAAMGGRSSQQSTRPERPAPTAGPISSWQAAAHACGLSYDTIRRRRVEVGDETEPWWATADDCRTWFRQLINGPEPSARHRPSQHPPAKKGLTLADRPKRRGRKE